MPASLAGKVSITESLRGTIACPAMARWTNIRCGKKPNYEIERMILSHQRATMMKLVGIRYSTLRATMML
ncbi:hypothetical protein LNAOJCKE_1036 [Methylorubrum aminovorans]|uniref:Transposase n=1 Tax=Methylorubrum aminovorans TaxID=269069 RepID=A0ABQ4U962_9HYPH|nr:hypothetical protein [Methylorubrum aminovorans]GJE63838.1 hypothetical protein LNAOJCKE_1036 [Methylorubrum aminovorans]